MNARNVCSRSRPFPPQDNSPWERGHRRHDRRSTRRKQLTDQEIKEAIRGHWDAIENGSHYRRDVVFGEDLSQVKHRGAAQVMATLKNLALGVYELKKERGEIKKGESFKAACRRLCFSEALKSLRR